MDIALIKAAPKRITARGAGKILVIKTASGSAGTSKPAGGGSKLVIMSSFLRVTKCLVSFINFLKFIPIAITLVRMMLMSQLAKSLFYFFLTGVFFHSQKIVVIFRHK